MPISQPNYLTQNPDGSIGALFSGGVQIPAGSSTAIEPSRDIEWIDTGSGALIAYEKGSLGTFQNTFIQQVQAPNLPNQPFNYSRIVMQAPDNQGGANIARIFAEVAGPKNPGGFIQQAVVIDETGSTDFVWGGNLRAVKSPIGALNVTFNRPISRITGFFYATAFVGVAGAYTIAGSFDGQNMGTNTFFFNEINSHKYVLLPVDFSITRAAGTYAMSVAVLGGSTDVNDNWGGAFITTY